MIQTGHSNGTSTDDEQKIIANTLFYLGQVTTDTNAQAHTGEDLAAPNKPAVTIKGRTVTVTTEDNGTNYQHYVVASDGYGGEYKSNVVETTVKTGVRGYVWKLSSNPQMTSEELGSNITNFPTKFDIKYKGKYLHIKAVDWAGNESAVASVYLDLKFNPEITLTSESKGPSDPELNSISKIPGWNYVKLNWTNTEEEYAGWSYRVYQKGENEAKFTTVSTKYNEEVKVLNIYPCGGSDQLQGWMNNYGKDTTTGKQLIKVDKVYLGYFNSDPYKYLVSNYEDCKSGNDVPKFKYDVLMFGSIDGDDNGDISVAALDATKKFIHSGRGVLFGHDTFHKNKRYENFADELNMSVSGGSVYDGHSLHGDYGTGGTSTIRIDKAGYINRYPHNIGAVGTNLSVPRCHTVNQVPYGNIWIRFNYNDMYLTDPGNFYLATSGNCGMIQTGHSNGAATPDEQKVIANTLFYLAQVTTGMEAEAHTGEDLAAPDVPTVTITGKDITVTTQDNGTTYEHYVVASDGYGGEYKSNVVTTPVKTGVRGYIWTINNRTQMTSDDLGHAVRNLPTRLNVRDGGKYIHIKAVDWAGNESEVKSVYINPIPVELTAKYEGQKNIDKQTGIAKTPGWNYVDLNWDDASDGGADVIFLIDLSGSMDDFRDVFKLADGPIVTIANQMIDKGMRVASIVMADAVENQIIGDFTRDKNKISQYVQSYADRWNHKFAQGLTTAMNMFEKKGEAYNKVIILFSDSDSDDEDEEDATKKAALDEMKRKDIGLYTVYRNDVATLIKSYSKGYVYQPSADKDKQVAAFNTIFKGVMEDIAYKIYRNDQLIDQTTEISKHDTGAVDTGAPKKPELTLKRIGLSDKARLNIAIEDTGTTYKYYVTQDKLKSNVVTVEVKTGVKNFVWSIDAQTTGNPTLQTANTHTSTTASEIETAINNTLASIKGTNNKRYLHIRGQDYAGNLGEVLNVEIKCEAFDFNIEYQMPTNINTKTGIAGTAGWNYTRLSWNKLSDMLTVNEDGKIERKAHKYDVYRNNVVQESNINGLSYTNEYYSNTSKGLDKAKPDKPVIDIRRIENGANLRLHVLGVDKGSMYEYYVKSGEVETNRKTQEVRTGIRGFAWTIDGSKDTKLGNTVSNPIIPPSSLNSNTYIGKWLHIKAIDYAGNASDQVDIQITRQNFELRKTYTEAKNENEIGIIENQANAGGSDIKLDWDKLNKTIKLDENSITYSDAKYTVYRKKQGESGYTAILKDTTNLTYTDKKLDNLGPLKPIVGITENSDEKKFEISVKIEDQGVSCEYYVQNEEAYTNTVIQEVKTGVKGFAWVIDNKQNTDPGTNINHSSFKYELSGNYEGKFIHIRGIDWAGNAGAIAHIPIDGRYIPLEDLDKTKELFCVQHGQSIPARADDKYLNATVKVNAGEYSFTQVVENPQTGDVIGRRFIEGTTVNPYGTQDIISYSLGKYKISMATPPRQPGKEGNASEKEAYLLNFYEQNDSLKSAVQKAMYTTDISKGNITWDWGDTAESKALQAEAEAYEAYRKAGYKPSHYKMNTECLMSQDYNQIVLGPFKLKYTPKGVHASGHEPVYFANIIGAKIYDQDGNLIGEKDKNGKTTSKLQWEFIYVDGKAGAKRTEEIFNYNNYKFPVGDEEFYIKMVYDDVLAKVKNISKIEFIHQEFFADAQYTILEGTYNKVNWRPNRVTSADKDALWCNEVGNGAKTCVHGKTTKHIIGCNFYLTATVYETGRSITSQKLLELEWAKMGYNTFIQTLTPENNNNGGNNGGGDNGGDNGGGDNGGDNGGGDNGGDNGGGDNGGEDKWKITMDFSGNVWNDGMENYNNGIKEQAEKGVEKVMVRAYRVDINKKRLGEVYTTYTDTAGNYKIKDATRGLYDLEFEYDGQTYKTTKLLVNGTVSDYQQELTQKKYANNSMTVETQMERQNLNNNFLEIAGNNSAYGAKGRIPLEYKNSKGQSELVTLKNDGFVKDEFKLNARTSTEGTYYPLWDARVINGVTYIKLIDAKDVNLGLAQRQKTDENLNIDVYESIFGIKGIKQSFIHSARNIRDKNNIKEVEEYVQYVNRADYEWRWQDYYNKFGEDFKKVWEKPEDCELEAYVDYMMVIRNEGENDFVRISEIADYYDKSYEYADHYRDIDLTSWAVIKKEDASESEPQNLSKTIKVEWKENSKYEGINNPYSDYYNKMYTNSLEELELKKGEYVELHVIFRVLKDDNGIKLDQTGEGKKNFAEINGYKTYNIADRSIAGLVDKDSKPGNLNPLQEDKSYYEDDEDKAPNYKLQLDPTTGGNTGGSDSDNNGDKTEGNSGTGESDTINRDENGNIIGYGNVLEGSVWEDLRRASVEHSEEYLKTLDNNQVIGDGIRQKEEPLINDVIVEVVEYFENPTTGASFSGIVRSSTTEKLLSLSNEGRQEGTYRFDKLSAGKYKVKFTYGKAEQLKKDTKYNGQDYQAINTEDIYINEELARKYDDLEIILALDNSNSMQGDSINKTKKAAKNLVEKLMAKLPGVKFGIVSFNSEAKLLIEPNNDESKVKKAIDSLKAGGETSIGRGIAKAMEAYSKDIDKKIMIILTDGEETVEDNEAVIKQVEKASDEQKIELVSILTKDQEQIFGTTEQARRGLVFRVEQDNIENEISQNIYEEALKLSVIRKDRSYGKDIEGDENTAGTRVYNIKPNVKMGIENGQKLDINSINQLSGTKRDEAVEELAKDSYMTAETGTVEFRANNTIISQVEQVNLALIERPRSELNLDSEILGIKITLSDGNVIIDTAKGITKNVMGLDKKDMDKDMPVSIYMDEEIMHGATITVKYKIRVSNVGEIDRMSNYIEGGSDDTVTTKAKVLFNFAGKNTVYKEDNGEKAIWEEIDKDKAEDILSEEAYDEIEDDTKILQTEAFNSGLYPIGSIEAKAANDENTFIERTVTLSKVMTPQDSKETLTYKNAMEIVESENEAGRRDYASVHGNGINKLEPDSAITSRIVITKPLGGQDANYYVIAVLVLVVLASGIVGIKVVLKKHRK